MTNINELCVAILTGKVMLKVRVLFEEHCFVAYCKVRGGSCTDVNVVRLK